MKREYRLGSKMGQMHIAPHKENHKDKIIEGLKKIKVGGTYEEISIAAGMRDDQVWKRLSELCRDGKIFDTSLLRKLKSGVPGTVWQLTEIPELIVPKPHLEVVFSLPDDKPIVQQGNLF